MEGLFVTLIVEVQEEKGNLGDPRFGLTNWLIDGVIYQNGKDR